MTALPGASCAPARTAVQRWLRAARDASVTSTPTVLIAFSGGPDSTALLLLLRDHAPALGASMIAIHVDHGLDAASAARAASARQIASRLGVRCEVHCLAGAPGAGDSSEAWARAERYALLERRADAHRAMWIVTAHHADDQAETVLLRIRYGTGIVGLAGIRPVRGRVARPLLNVPRAALQATLQAYGWCHASGDASALEAQAVVHDPTNDDLSVPRNRLRHVLLPRWSADAPDLSARLCALARRARDTGARLRRHLHRHVDIRPEAGGAASLDASRLRRLPAPVSDLALDALGRAAGRDRPAPAPARAELRRQLAMPDARVGCDAGAGDRWRVADGRLWLLASSATATCPPFEYSRRGPGTIHVEALRLRLRIRRGPTAPWMFRRAPDRAAFRLPAASRPHDAAGERSPHFVVRNRRPGDRLHPLGGPGRRRLAKLLIDRRVPAWRRDHIPLLCVGENLLWIPGLALAEWGRLTDADATEPVWIAELIRNL
ncbi:MAG: tRNA lysidine(34) synthetase TilS [Pseudomonadota bacterium]